MINLLNKKEKKTKGEKIYFYFDIFLDMMTRFKLGQIEFNQTNN